jgi:hypothetical protein
MHLHGKNYKVHFLTGSLNDVTESLLINIPQSLAQGIKTP